MVSQEINIRFYSSAEELLKVWKDYFLKKYKSDIIINFILICIAITIFILTEYNLAGGIIFIFSFLYLLFIYYFHYLAAISYINKYKSYHNNLLVILTEEDIQYYSPLSESKVKWESFIKCFRGKYYYLLFDIFGRYLLIPESVLDEDKNKEWFEIKLKTVGILHQS